MAKVLITANASNRAKIFLPIADSLNESGTRVTFVSLDPILYGEASNILKSSRHPYIEFPYKTEKPLFEMNKKERFGILRKIQQPTRELLDRLSPDVIMLGAAAYAEGVIIEEARKKGIKTVLMQDGLRIYEKYKLHRAIGNWFLNKLRALVNEWTLALCGAHYFFAPFETNRVDKILLFNDVILEEICRKGVRQEKLASVGNPFYDSLAPLPLDKCAEIRFFFGLPPERCVALFGMQCFHRHKVISIIEEEKIVKDLVDAFRGIPNFDLIIKLHPENDYDHYRNLFFRWEIPDNVHLVKDEFSPRELLSISSVFMTVYSTMALEALLHGIPVITLDYTSVKYRLNLEPAIFRAESLEQIRKILLEWDINTPRQIKDKVITVIDRELANLGFAAEKAANEILELAKI